jgi:hypothetical protein
MSTIDANTVDGVPRRRIVIASMVGTTIEFYDFYIYATAAISIFPHLFFPKGNPTTALLSRARWAQSCSGTSAIAPGARPR